MKLLRAVFLLFVTAGFSRAVDLPRVYSWSPAALAAARQRLAQNDPALRPALDQLRREADAALKFLPVSVMDKHRMPPSGDEHDYLSQAPYWWPDPKNPKGPYVRHDGRQNPERLVGTDFPLWSRLSPTVETLGLAYYFTGDEAYARRAAQLVRVWFLDPATRMNPNLNYGQYVPGLNQGRGAGVLEFHLLMPVCDALGLLAGSPAWPESDAQAFRTWLGRYFSWLTTSPLALSEAAEKNNHGTWCDAQIADLALVLGRADLARDRLLAVEEFRISTQIEPDGRQPLELARTKSLNYSLLNLEGLFALARLGEPIGVDRWTYATPDGRSLRVALRYLAPYADPDKPWPKRDLVAGDRLRLFPLLAEALRHGDDPSFRDLLNRFGPPDGRWRLLWP